MALTEKQARFVAEYLVDLDATKAAKRAGYSEKTAEQIGYQLLQKTSVQKAIQKAIAERAKRTQITQDMVLRELAAIGFARATDFVKIDGSGYVRLTPTDNLTEEQQRAIASIKDGKFGVELKLYDKVRALEKLGEHLGMFTGKGGQQEDTPDDGFVDALKGEAAQVWQE